MPNLGEAGGSSDWITGAYKIVCRVDQLIYVGGAYKDFMKRKKKHWGDLRKGCHDNEHLQAAWNKHGEENFEFKVIERSPPDKESVMACEQKWLDLLRPYDRKIGYNKCMVAQSTLGARHSDETRAKISEIVKEKMQDPDLRKKISEKAKGRKHTDEAKAKMSASRTGSKRSPEAVAKTAAANRGRIMPDDVKQKMSEVRKAWWEENPMTPERREKYSEAGKKRRHKQESKDKMSALMDEGKRRGPLIKHVSSNRTAAQREAISERMRNISDETRRKRSEAAKAQWARVRARKLAMENTKQISLFD